MGVACVHEAFRRHCFPRTGHVRVLMNTRSRGSLGNHLVSAHVWCCLCSPRHLSLPRVRSLPAWALNLKRKRKKEKGKKKRQSTLLVLHGSRRRRPVAVLDPAVQLHPLQHRAEPAAPTRVARRLPRRIGDAALLRAVRVLDVEDGLAGAHEGSEGGALVVLGALLVHGEVHDVQHVVDEVARVLEPDGQAALGALGGQEAHKVDGGGSREAEAVCILLEEVSGHGYGGEGDLRWGV
ncbi:hypothetical protein VTK73DRAFT_4043 [Phialemonium thermophilum]|uniref:Uncharacterized protein n=1 Tax=Phialemonium thermophilum TaxID=223376 RepID=A0ABR3VC45_9PEZI